MADNTPEYHLLTASTAAELSELVNQRLAEGFQLHGAPFSSPAGTVALLQAVVRLPASGGAVPPVRVQPA